MQRYTDYDTFAWLYNREWGAWAVNVFPLLKEIAGDSLPDGAEILDVCCGTGQLAKALTEEGYRVTGIDNSREMLRYARRNAPAARFMLRDARSFKLTSRYDAAFSTFDALNHILKPEELQATFDNTGKCLKNGGIFIFDLNTERAFRTQWARFNRAIDNPDYYYVVHGGYDKAKRTGGFYLTVFQRKLENWKRTDLVIKEKYYTQTEVKSALNKAGFTDIRTFAADPKKGLYSPDKKATRIFYRARKK